MAAPTSPPVGVVAMLFTDVEGSTALARLLGDRWAAVQGRHHAIIGAAIRDQGGWVDGTEGDAFFATFAAAAQAVRAAVEAQRRLRAEPWPPGAGEVRVRMAVHVGSVQRTETGYVGLDIHLAARVAAAGHGGQVLLTQPAVEADGDVVPVDDLGLHRLRDFPRPEHLYCLVVDGRGARAFPPPRTLDVRPTNLPPPGRLVGREEDLKALVDALTDGRTRLLTITGPGGCGKTSMARRRPGAAGWLPWWGVVGSLGCPGPGERSPASGGCSGARRPGGTDVRAGGADRPLRGRLDPSRPRQHGAPAGRGR